LLVHDCTYQRAWVETSRGARREFPNDRKGREGLHKLWALIQVSFKFNVSPITKRQKHLSSMSHTGHDPHPIWMYGCIVSFIPQSYICDVKPEGLLISI
jgi:hypothetical protein